ncbi:MAG: ATP phosphoribosyltransferase [Nitrospirota bacterium]
MRDRDIITIALPKGKLLNASIKLFKKVGIDVDIKSDSRKLVFEDKGNRYRYMIVRAVDIPTYIEYGASDIGIVGKDVLLEQDKNIYEPLDLGFGYCKLVIAEPKAVSKNSLIYCSKVKVATKYPNITEWYFSNKGIPCEIIKLYGSVELAPIVGLAEKIVDLISTGKTLKENNLREVETITESTARLVVNRASHKIKYKRIRELIEELGNRI